MATRLRTEEQASLSSPQPEPPQGLLLLPALGQGSAQKGCPGHRSGSGPVQLFKILVDIDISSHHRVTLGFVPRAEASLQTIIARTQLWG